MITTTFRARERTDVLARLLATPPGPEVVDPRRGVDQSLSLGAPGVALLHLERGDVTSAHAWLRRAARSPIAWGPNSGLFNGGPALAFALHAADAHYPTRYRSALDTLDDAILTTTLARVVRAHERIDRGDLPVLTEFDLIRGLTGVGVYLLLHDPEGEPIRAVLSYLVRLAQPLPVRDGRHLPGWWTSHGPADRPDPNYPGGHSNMGMAHGVCGPLALLAQAMKRGTVVPGHSEAITTMCEFLDGWRQDCDTGPWWPQRVGLVDLHAGHTSEQGPARPSWCYGTPGLARAQQLAGQALDDPLRQQEAEHALHACLTDRRQLAQTQDASLCHGWAGLLQTTWRMAHVAHTPDLTTQLPHLVEALVHHLDQHPPASPDAPDAEYGLLSGTTGAALALHTATTNEARTAWDACLLIG